MAEMHSCSVSWESRAVKLEQDVAHLVYEGLDSPIALSCAILLRHSEFDQLASKTINPVDYNSMGSFRKDYQAVSLLRKSKLLPTTFDKEAKARETYRKSEELCLATNERLLGYQDGLVSPLDPLINNVIVEAQLFIRQLLAPLTKRELSRIEGDMQFGPGATVGVKRVVTSGRKFDLNNIDCTPELLTFGIFCLPEIWKQRVTGFTPVTYAELEFVSKDCKTHRAIEKQPTLNIYVQKGIAQWLRRGLSSFGLHLESQKGNQDLAMIGSSSDELVTADLVSASDTNAHQCVRLLFKYRPDAVSLLEWARVGYSFDKKTKTLLPLEKFSAMGNGYTFELETIVFLSLVVACRKILKDHKPFRVYGDDIIVSRNVWPLLSKTLTFLGFNVNTQKTFGDTYFRESCGADYFNGVNVRPIFFKQKVKDGDDFKELCYIYANQLLLSASRLTGGIARDSCYKRAWLHLYLSVPKHLRFRVPDGFDANGFLGDFDEAVPGLKRAKDGWQGYLFRYSYRPSERTARYAYGKLISSLKVSGTLFSYGEEDIRGRKLPAATKVGYALAWPHFGPWS